MKFAFHVPTYARREFIQAELALTRFPRRAKRRELMFLAVGTGLLLFLGRSPQLQSWLTLFPLLAILAAAAFVRMRGLRSRRALAFLAACVLLPGVMSTLALDPNYSYLQKDARAIVGAAVVLPHAETREEGWQYNCHPNSACRISAAGTCYALAHCSRRNAIDLGISTSGSPRTPHSKLQ
jgi:hypothetical protein